MHIFTASLSQDIPTIDLHGMRHMMSALEELEKKLYTYYQQGNKICRVIYGIGEGVLAKEVQDSLTKNPMVREWHHEETGGSCIVLL